MQDEGGLTLISMLRSRSSSLVGCWNWRCSGPPQVQAHVVAWIQFVLLYPCPQRLLFSVFNLVFVLLFLAFALHKLCARFLSKAKSKSKDDEATRAGMNGSRTDSSELVKVSWKHITTVSVASVYAVVFVGLSICRLAIIIILRHQRQEQQRGTGWHQQEKEKGSFLSVESAYTVTQTLAWLVFAAVAGHEKKFRATLHPRSLRLWWAISFIFSALFSASAIARLASQPHTQTETKTQRLIFLLDDIFALLAFPGHAYLLFAAFTGTTGISISSSSNNNNTGTAEESQLTEPLLNKESESAPESSNPDTESITSYASAGILSKLTFVWLNVLLKKGYRRPLQLRDVPIMGASESAEHLYLRFKSMWPAPAQDKQKVEADQHPVRWTLLRCFWQNFAVTASLALAKLCVMYIGPMLIQSFVSYTSSPVRVAYQGYLLVLILLLAKVVEVACSHQYAFQCQKLGMMLRATLITSIYRKGLRLSSSARQSHGVGQIVNYMSVDTQQLSDMMLQLHYVWMMPLQVGVALVLLFGVLGMSMLSGFLCMAIVMGVVAWRNQSNKMYQFNVMKERDLRMKATNESLNYMRVIKLQAWENHFKTKVEALRTKEYGWLAKFMYSLGLNIVILWSTPTLVSALTFAVCVYMGVPLTAGKVFTAISIFRILQEPIRNFPQALISLSQAIVSLDRLDRYMTSNELDPQAVQLVAPGHHIAVSIRDGSFLWDEADSKATLRDINVEVTRGALVAIVGTVGSGKSSLLASVLGEMPKLSGEIKVSGSTAYVAQTAWIQNASIQDNILFGLPMDSARYRNVIKVCSLEKDLEMMEFGDQTEIGERGINLSGGQKQRIQLARAVYQDSDIYLLDDIFSAVDAHTGTDIYKECIRGALGQKTVLLVTHQIDFLHGADLILVMRDGMIVQSGKYDDLLHLKTDFEALVAAHDHAMGLVEAQNASENHSISENDEIASEEQVDGSKSRENTPRSRDNTRPAPSESNILRTSSSKLKIGTSKLIDEEQRETGQVSWKVYWLFMTKAYGWSIILALLAVQTVWQLVQLASDYWLAYQTSGSKNFKPKLFVEVYTILSAATCVFIFFRTVLVTQFGLKTCQVFFEQMLDSMFHAPMSFFDTTPSGRVLSRSSTDQTNLDIFLPFFVGVSVSMYFSGISIVIVTCQVVWPTIFVILPLAWVNVWYQRYYIASSRELTRLDQITKAPVIHHFSESIAGFVTIRCFKKEKDFSQVNTDRVNSNIRMDFHNFSSNEWLGVRVEMIGAIVLCASTLLLVSLPANVIKPELVGLTLSYGLSLNSLLFFAVWLSCLVENKMVSVERIRQFSCIPSEAPWTIPGCLPSPDWPSEGNIELRDLQVRYRPNTPLVLKGLSLSIKGGDKIGVVGRTGSGKSTLIQAMFRLVEACGGHITIDGVDIANLGLHQLRSRFGIIPQEPVLFEGTVRSNVDPLGQHSDDEIWKSLERCQLADTVSSKSEKLDSPVVDNGENWSVGQRQLLCLGRVMLKGSRILFLDEATASVDAQTDGTIQTIIRQHFAACTIISIAHRIPTVMDCDKVLVIDAGIAKEYGTPAKLLGQPSLFGALVQEYANRSHEA